MQAIIMKLRKTNLFNNVSIGDELQLQKTLEGEKNIIALLIDEAQSIHVIIEEPNHFKIINNGKNTYKVLSAYFNGLSDRTTYNGLHRGDYDNAKYTDALQVAKNRCEGRYKTLKIKNISK